MIFSEKLKNSGVQIVMFDVQDFIFCPDTMTVTGFRDEDCQKKYERLFEILEYFTGTSLILFNKSDLLDKQISALQKISVEGGKLGIGNLDLSSCYLTTLKDDCVVSGDGVKQIIFEKIEKKLKKIERISGESDILFHRARHLTTLSSLSLKIDEFTSSKNLDFDKRSNILRSCIKEVEALTGSVWNEEILDEIFEEFCIGK